MAKTFKTLVAASAATGVGLMDGMTFSALMEIGSYVLGHPVWTHELGDKATTERIEAALRQQLPLLPSRELAHENWQTAADAALSAYGETVEVIEGAEQRTKSPIDSLARMTGRPEDIIAVAPVEAA